MCLALIFAIQKLKHYMQAHTVRVISKADPIKYILSRPVLSGRLAKWAVLINQHDIVHVPQKAVKGQALADFLEDHPIPADWELSDDLPGEVFFVDTLPPWQLYFDGAARKDGAGAGIVLVSPEKHILPYSFTLTHQCSNNVAEYQALILGLEMAKEMGICDVDIYGDSKLVIHQLLDDYDVKKDDLVPYHKHALQLLSESESAAMEHVPRSANKVADALANLAATLALGAEDYLSVPVCNRWVVTPPEFGTEEATNAVSVYEISEEDWRQPLIDYLEHGKLPDDVKHRMEIRRRAARFIHYKGTLYKRSFLATWWRCLGEEKAQKVMEEAHSGVCGAHQSGPKLHDRIKRLGYYWPTMVQDCMEYAKRCEACQFHANFIHQPPEPLHPTVTSWPFEAWGLDVVGPITPKSSGGHAYILAATDYFSKWAEAVALREVKKENVVEFIRNQIIFRYGVPRYVITDNGTPFFNKLMTSLCEKFKFKQRKSSMYNAPANRLVEAFNKTLCTLLSKVTARHKKDWHERLGEALWAYRTTYKSATQATPYSLVYGVEAILPLEIQIPSLRMAIQEGLTEEENAKLRLAELEALDEKRLGAQQKLDCYQARLSRAFNKRVRVRSFQVRDMVLAVRRPIITSKKTGSKFTSKWDGPYVVQEVYTNGAYKIVDADGVRVGPINGKLLKRYYP
ncbi:Gypsy retrotransposon integrase-like protein 1 [Bienertia sinuspersici]